MAGFSAATQAKVEAVSAVSAWVEARAFGAVFDTATHLDTVPLKEVSERRVASQEPAFSSEQEGLEESGSSEEQ